MLRHLSAPSARRSLASQLPWLERLIRRLLQTAVSIGNWYFHSDRQKPPRKIWSDGKLLTRTHSGFPFAKIHFLAAGRQSHGAVTAGLLRRAIPFRSTRCQDVNRNR